MHKSYVYYKSHLDSKSRDTTNYHCLRDYKNLNNISLHVRNICIGAAYDTYVS